MKESYLKLLKNYFMQSIETIAGIDFYEDVVTDIELQKSTSVQPIYDELKKQLDDKEYVAKLSIPEQHVLGRNELKYKRLLREMDDAVSKLMLHKWSQNIKKALWILEETKLYLEYLLLDVDPDGVLIKAQQLIDPKKFQSRDYLGKIASCQIMLNIVSDVLKEGDIDSYSRSTINAAIGKSIVILQHEIEDREANGAPELYKFEIPKLEEPELPEEAPDALQLLLPVEDEE